MITFDQIASFQRRDAGDDGAGNKVAGNFAEVFREWVGIKELKGGEGVLAGRLAGHQQAILSVRVGSNAARINAGWVAVAGGVAWNVKEPPRLTDDRANYEMLVERGRGNV